MSLADIDSRAAVLEAIREFDKLGRTKFLQQYGFGMSKNFFIEHEGKRYDSKAIVGVSRKFLGRNLPPLTPKDFSGGESTVKAKLESLGFTVIRDSDRPEWSDAELDAIVTDYLDMLKAELAGEPYVKSAHRKALLPKLQDRTEGSVEFKYANISAALFEVGLPYIDGYKPRENAQTAVSTVLDAKLAENAALRAALEARAATQANPNALEQVSPPQPRIPKNQEAPKRRAVRIDFQRREEQNRQMGLRGEELIVQFEQNRLREAGHSNLASKVEHVSKTQGDGLGYDVRSFDETNGAPLFIEVKTTTGNIDTPFLISVNEVLFSAENPGHFALYRVFDFSGDPKFYIRKGPIRQHFNLVDKVYLASSLPPEAE